MEFINTLETTILTSLPADLQKLYHDALEAGHPHAKKLPLMNPFHVLLICIAYLIIVFVGKAIMKNREKFELKLFSILHNGFLVGLSAYMSFQAARIAIRDGYSIFGNGVDESERGFEVSAQNHRWKKFSFG